MHTTWTSNLFMTKGRTHYHGLIRGPHMEIYNNCYNQPPKFLCNFYSIYIINRYGHGQQVGDSWHTVFWWGKLKARGHLEELESGEIIILKFSLEKSDGVVECIY